MAAQITIGSRQVGLGHPPFLILEAGINHNGQIDLALEMIHAAASSKADAIKFQTFKATEFVGDSKLPYTYTSQGRQVTESMLDMFRRHEFTPEQWQIIREECDRLGIMFLSTPQNASDLELLLQLQISAIKVGSDDLTNTPLLAHYAKTGLPLLLSCGMADHSEVEAALGAIGADRGYPCVVLICTSQYPTPAADANVARVRTLAKAFPQTTVGFSDHTQGVQAAIIAAALGACVFEKHFTLDRNLPGPDHWFSETPTSSAEWIVAIRQTAVMLGHGRIEPTSAEREMRAIARRSVTALCNIAADEVFTTANLGLRRPGTGLSPSQLDKVVGQRAHRAIAAGELVSWADVASGHP